MSLRLRYLALGLWVALSACDGAASLTSRRPAGGETPQLPTDPPPGNPGDPVDPVEPPPEPPPFDVGPAPLRRLSRVEFTNTARALFGLTSSPGDTWPEDPMSTGFDTDVSGQSATSELVEQQLRSAEQIADQVVAKLPALLPCATSTTVTAAVCGQRFIDEQGPRVFRRPLEAADRAQLQKVLTWALGRGDLSGAVRLVTVSLLLSPSFLYRPEVRGPREVVEGVAVQALTAHERATRLAYFFTQSGPDDALLTAAAKGELSTDEQLSAQAQRLLATTAGRAATERFFEQWLHLDRLQSAHKDATLFPQFNEALRSSMGRGTKALIRHVVFDSPDGTLGELLTAPYAFVDQLTAPLYGLTGSFGTQLAKTPLSAQPRSGLLSDVGVLTALANEKETSPVARGVFVWEHLLCQTVAAPPPDLNVQPPPPDPSLTTRERFAQHRSDPSCAGCHASFDPPGFALENYDALGRYRATENGKPIDAVGSMSLQGVVATFDGARQLGDYLARHPATQRCLNTKWFTYLFGRPPSQADAYSLESLASLRLETPLRERFVGLVTTPAFSHRPPVAAEECAP